MDNFHRVLALYNRCNTIAANAEALRAARNAVQEAVLLVADRRCEVYKTLLSTSDMQFNFWSGLLVTGLGTAGAVFDGAAQELAAAAGFVGGSSAVFQETHFKNQLLEVIYSGLDTKRLSLRNEINGKQGKAYIDYMMQTAIGDAARYSGACNIVEGTKEAKERLARSGEVGLDTAQRVMRMVARAKDEAQLMDLPPEQRLQRQKTLDLLYATQDERIEATPALFSLKTDWASQAAEKVTAIRRELKLLDERKAAELNGTSDATAQSEINTKYKQLADTIVGNPLKATQAGVQTANSYIGALVNLLLDTNFTDSDIAGLWDAGRGVLGIRASQQPNDTRLALVQAARNYGETEVRGLANVACLAAKKKVVAPATGYPAWATICGSTLGFP